MSGSELMLVGGVPAVAANYIEDVFSTWVYPGNWGGTGTTSTVTINPGVDLSTKGGMIWFKNRTSALSNVLFDTARGNDSGLFSNTSNAAVSYYSWSGNRESIAFTTTGATVDHTSVASGDGYTNYTNSKNFVSWLFRKQPKFFDVVTYTGDGVNGRAISHNLGSSPGCIIVKVTNTADDWVVWHRSADGSLRLNSTAGTGSFTNAITAVSSTTFTVVSNGEINGNGNTYVAYLFAHDAGGFGLTGSDNVISCGSFTTDGSGNATVSLGYEPQWIMRKGSTIASNWEMYDNLRGITAASTSQAANYLLANTSGAEGSSPQISINATGFAITSGASSQTYIYIAIRRGPMKTPTDTNKVFDINVFNYGSISLPYKSTSGFVTDLSIDKGYAGTYAVSDWQWQERLIGTASILRSNSTSSESTNGNLTFDYNDGVSFNNSISVSSGSDNVHYQFSRAPGFFDVVCYTGTGTTPQNITHNLGVAPELMIVKVRNEVRDWTVYSGNAGQYLLLNTTDAVTSNTNVWDNTAPSSTVFRVGNFGTTNSSGKNIVAYLFASVSGVSKVGSYTGTGTTKQIDCGFTGGSRLVIIKRTDSTGDWYVYDSSRGIIGGNDPYMFLNTSAGEVGGTDYIDSYNPGFELSSTAPAALNANGGTYIFLAISN